MVLACRHCGSQHCITLSMSTEAGRRKACVELTCSFSSRRAECFSRGASARRAPGSRRNIWIFLNATRANTPPGNRLCPRIPKFPLHSQYRQPRNRFLQCPLQQELRGIIGSPTVVCCVIVARSRKRNAGSGDLGSQSKSAQRSLTLEKAKPGERCAASTPTQETTFLMPQITTST